MNDLTFNSISEIKEAYQIKWNLQRQESQQQVTEITPAKEKVDYDVLAEDAYYAALELGESEKFARAIYRSIKKGR